MKNYRIRAVVKGRKETSVFFSICGAKLWKAPCFCEYHTEKNHRASKQKFNIILDTYSDVPKML